MYSRGVCFFPFLCDGTAGVALTLLLVDGGASTASALELEASADVDSASTSAVPGLEEARSFTTANVGWNVPCVLSWSEGTVAVTSVPEELHDATELVGCLLPGGGAEDAFGFLSRALVPGRDNFCGEFDAVDMLVGLWNRRGTRPRPRTPCSNKDARTQKSSSSTEQEARATDDTPRVR